MKLALQLHNPFLSQVLPLEPSALQLQARKTISNIIPLDPDHYVSNTKNLGELKFKKSLKK